MGTPQKGTSDFETTPYPDGTLQATARIPCEDARALQCADDELKRDRKFLLKAVWMCFRQMSSTSFGDTMVPNIE